jgi:hypothetical protein
MKHHIVQYMLGIPTIHTWYEQLIYHRPAPVNAICQESRPFRPAHGSMTKEMLSALSHIIVVLQSEHKFLCTLTGLWCILECGLCTSKYMELESSSLNKNNNIPKSRHQLWYNDIITNRIKHKEPITKFHCRVCDSNTSLRKHHQPTQKYQTPTHCA